MLHNEKNVLSGKLSYLRKEKPVLRYLILGNWALQVTVLWHIALNSDLGRVLAQQVCYYYLVHSPLGTSLLYQVLLPALKAMQYQLHLQLLFPPPTFPSAQSNQYFPLHFSSLDFPPYAYGSCAKIDLRNVMTHSFHWYSALPYVRLRASLHVKFSPKWNQVQVYRK